MTIKNIRTNCQVVREGNAFTIFSYGTPVWRVVRSEHGEPMEGTGRLWSWEDARAYGRQMFGPGGYVIDRE